MKKFLFATMMTTVLVTASMFAQANQPQAPGNPAGATKTLTGEVSDTMCGAKHMAKDKTAAECARECAKAGSDYALVVGGKVYSLKGDKTELGKFAGQRATVTGTLDGNNITVQSITAAQKAAMHSGKSSS
jgi:hypothetical protein